MLYHFKNMLDILRLRYKHPAEYTYPLPVILADIVAAGHDKCCGDVGIVR